jgi:hypothetical protein
MERNIAVVVHELHGNVADRLSAAVATWQSRGQGTAKSSGSSVNLVGGIGGKATKDNHPNRDE